MTDNFQFEPTVALTCIRCGTWAHYWDEDEKAANKDAYVDGWRLYSGRKYRGPLCAWCVPEPGKRLRFT
jgi:hypothetical protein